MLNVQLLLAGRTVEKMQVFTAGCHLLPIPRIIHKRDIMRTPRQIAARLRPSLVIASRLEFDISHGKDGVKITQKGAS